MRRSAVTAVGASLILPLRLKDKLPAERASDNTEGGSHPVSRSLGRSVARLAVRSVGRPLGWCLGWPGIARHLYHLQDTPLISIQEEKRANETTKYY